MARALLFVLGVALLCAAALAALWAAGQVLAALGALLTGAAGVLGRLLIFLVLGALAGGVSYFVASAWRPNQLVSSQPGSSQPGSSQLARVPTEAGPSPRGSRWRRGKRTVVATTAVDPAPVDPPPVAPAEAVPTVVIAATPEIVPPAASENVTEAGDSAATPRPPSS